jgi:peptide/nickel transport system substrate-binding protein
VAAPAVVAALNRARRPEMSGQLATTGLYARYLGDADIHSAGNDRVVIVAAAPMADLLDVLADIPIAADDGMVGTGPYRVVERDAGRLVMEAIARHWSGRPRVRRIVWRAEPSVGARLAALAGGDADVTTELSIGPGAWDHRGGSTLFEAPTSHCVVFMCRASSGVCLDQRVRQALNHALDVPAIIARVKHGAATPLNGPLSSLSLGYDPATSPYMHDPRRAKELLKAAGYRHGFELVIDVPTVVPDEAITVAAMMAEQYAVVGISASLRLFNDRPAYAEMIQAKLMDDLACFDSTPISTYRVLREKFHSGASGPWWQGYRNTVVDQLLDEASSTAAVPCRRDYYRQAFRLIRDDAPWIFLYSPTTAAAIGPRARGVRLEAQGLLGFD